MKIKLLLTVGILFGMIGLASSHSYHVDEFVIVEEWCPVSKKHYHDGVRFYYSHYHEVKHLIEHNHRHNNRRANRHNDRIRRYRDRTSENFNRIQQRANERNRRYRHNTSYYVQPSVCTRYRYATVCY